MQPLVEAWLSVSDARLHCGPSAATHTATTLQLLA